MALNSAASSVLPIKSLIPRHFALRNIHETLSPRNPLIRNLLTGSTLEALRKHLRCLDLQALTLGKSCLPPNWELETTQTACAPLPGFRLRRRSYRPTEQSVGTSEEASSGYRSQDRWSCRPAGDKHTPLFRPTYTVGLDVI